jgi:alkylation response protein AidB-like acyl-CoA dehydrogenase
MDFHWSDEQRELRETVLRFAQQRLGNNQVERDDEEAFNHDGWRLCGEFGLPGLTVPESYGGLGLDPLTAAGVLEMFGYGCRDNGLTFSLNAHLWTAAMPLVAFGTDEQKQRFLRGLASGTLIGGNAMSEPGTGSDAFAMSTAARRDGSDYLLTGSKIYVTNAPIADLLVVFATLDKASGPRGITAFIVEKNMPGFRVGSKLRKMGWRKCSLTTAACQAKTESERKVAVLPCSIIQ